MQNTKPNRLGKVALPFWRRQWKKLVALMDDHPLPFILFATLALLLVVFYAVPLWGFAHAAESLQRWKLEMVGGENEIDRGVPIYDLILSIEPEEHDRVDLVSMGGVPLAGTPFRSDIETLVGARGGKVRFLALDPRVSAPEHPSYPYFTSLAADLGQETWEFRAAVWHATAVLLGMKEQLGEGFEVHFVNGLENVREIGGFIRKPWLNAYGVTNPRNRMDVVAADPADHPGEAYLAGPAKLYVDRPDNAEVVALGVLFEEWWRMTTVLDGALREQFLAQLEHN